eukprot:TRINITY_DN7102_c0_g1_i7.p1 TRINITY_DN7102_c0_g1~~TRINITY_DN7102_c0_g1_i7.p1  ORF type:complete len:162 (+),score=11.39 TRINITY_DN7102_c0_g1_i7:114-599(+)
MVQQFGRKSSLTLLIIPLLLISIKAQEQLLQMGSFQSWNSFGGFLEGLQPNQGYLIDKLSHNQQTTQQQQGQYQQQKAQQQYPIDAQKLQIIGPTLSQTTISLPEISVESGLLYPTPGPSTLLDDVQTFLLTPSPPPPSPSVSVYSGSTPKAQTSIFDQLN